MSKSKQSQIIEVINEKTNDMTYVEASTHLTVKLASLVETVQSMNAEMSKDFILNILARAVEEYGA